MSASVQLTEAPRCGRFRRAEDTQQSSEAIMLAKSLIRIAIMVVLVALGGHTLSSAQPVRAAGPPVRYARPRIVVTPRPYQYRRRCTDWLELQYRPSGTVLYPQYSCWWE
jgi:hypothetical protein